MLQAHYTPAQIEAGRKLAADACYACIEATRKGTERPNDPAAWIAHQERHAADLLAGKYDHTFSVQQLIHYAATGVSVPLLP